MQTETKVRRISPGIRGRVNVGNKPDINSVRCATTPKKALTSFACPGPGVLNYQFQEILPDSFSEVSKGLVDENEIDIKASVKYLYDSAINYSRLLNKPFNYKCTGNNYYDILNIYAALTNNIPEDQKLNLDLDPEGNYLFFIIYGSCWFPDEFVFLPIKAIEFMQPKVADIFKQFVKFFSVSQDIDFATEHYDMSYVLDCWMPDIIENNEEHDDEDVKISKRYKTGDIAKKFREFEKQKIIHPDKLLQNCNEVLSGLNGKSKDLIQIIIGGIPLLQEDCLGNYGYNDQSEQIKDDCYREDMSAVDFSRTLAIIWDDEDFAGQMFMECLNSSIGEYGCQDPAQIEVLKPRTKKVFQFSDYPLRFREWFIRLIQNLESYE